jgi:hypothetical protein
MVARTQKAAAVEGLSAFHHVGLLINKPPGLAGLLFV